jgi:hypothetical protein
MFGVDKGDQIRGHWGGFSTKVHFKKWYKCVWLGILDCGLLNALIAWNLSAEKRYLKRNRLSRHHFHSYIAQSMCAYINNINPTEKDAEYGARPTTTFVETTFVERLNVHSDSATKSVRRETPHINAERNIVMGHTQCIPDKETFCQVCNMESKWFPQKKEWKRQTRSNVRRCADCGIAAHHQVQHDSTQFIHSLTMFHGLSCWEIMHTPLGLEIWPRPNKKPSLSRSHRIVRTLRAKHNLPVLGSRKRKAMDEQDQTNDQDADDEAG